jgi:hypothetical protein
MATRVFSRTGFALWIGATLGAACVIPYVEALTPTLAQAASRLGVPTAVVVLLSIAQSAVMLAVMTFSGLWAARKLGLGAPVLDAWLYGHRAPPDLRRHALVAAILGLASGLAIVALDLWLFLPLSRPGVGSLVGQHQPPAWTGLLASIEGGVTEEVELRLFLLSFVALGLRAARKAFKAAPTSDLSPAVFWTANILAAIAFGLGHLPTTARLVPLTAVIVIRAIVLNGVVGVIAGWLFWRRGIEMAMVCHFSADLVLHVAAPALQPWLLGLAA